MTGCNGEQANQLFVGYIHKITPNLFLPKLRISTEKSKREPLAFKRKEQTQPRMLVAKTDRTPETPDWNCSAVINLKKRFREKTLALKMY